MFFNQQYNIVFTDKAYYKYSMFYNSKSYYSFVDRKSA